MLLACDDTVPAPTPATNAPMNTPSALAPSRVTESAMIPRAAAMAR